MLKKMKAGRYQQNVQAKAAYEASRPTESTYALDKTDEVFETIVDEEEEEKKLLIMDKKKPLKARRKHKGKNRKKQNEQGEEGKGESLTVEA